ncbi:aldehyde dehydrogenase (NADP(+)) [Actinoallomurus iriomotensis]|uniref:2,5-dioxovalerate dehydrogenase n=1 Tax=Actinoallomurus iriomotensis TaxID=478107 RepID=A0A9W6VPH5_9ACTN|nr:aldehyde dehydrogenase (NADP(+)) [Actinoallomurus iriomotensis]GLY75695.1 2,5-dioxovalerate dehydrogenase [Actinoallomurus iriomotensis]
MPLKGTMFIGAERRPGSGPAITSHDPRTGASLEPAYGTGTDEDVADACERAASAAVAYRSTSPGERAAFLERIAERIEDLGDELVDRAVAESGLPRGRISGERDRTTAQLRLFADEVRAGEWADTRIDPALPDRRPAPRPDLRQRHLAVGPVAVFGASNFPLAFSVAGGDTASALAAGCPVVVKGHSAHLGTSELVGSAVADAVRDSGLPEGVFSLLFAAGNEVGQALVADPRIRAVGFTGSQAGGLALQRTAAARAVPIPVYAEMSSVNPVFLLPGALRERAAGLAEGFAGSLTLGAGQFCTNPGLIVAVDGPELTEFLATAVRVLAATTGQTMLTEGIHAAYERSTAGLLATDGVRELCAGLPGEGENAGVARLFSVAADVFLGRPELQDEAFGAASTVVICRDPEQLREVAAALRGQLTATVHHGEGDREVAAALLPLLEERAGRILFDGWPTGVEVTHAMVHGGPYPATSDGRTTSVGTLAIRRFLRPVCYQNVPAELLPPEVSDDNAYGLPRRIDGARR